MTRKFALIIGNSEYQDTRLARLMTPNADVNDLAGLLRAPEIGGFDEVTTLLNESAASVRRRVAMFFAQKKPDDLLLLYFSGHGVRDDQGILYLAVRDTEHDLLNATAIPAVFITAEMDRSRSRRQVLILDCCHSGAFAQGTKGAVGSSAGTATAFQGTGYGRVVFTATDATQYAWEGDQIIGNYENSVFTHYLAEGLHTGAADADRDGWITLDELYDYVYEQVVTRTPKQTPGKWSYKQQGEIVIARNPRAPTTKPAALPAELQQTIDDPRPWVREGAVRELERLLSSESPGNGPAAHGALERLANDDSRRVAAAAAQVLAAYVKTPRPDAQRVEQERLLDAAIAQRVPVHKPTELLVLIRRKESGGLAARLSADQSQTLTPQDVTSSRFYVEFPTDADGRPGPTDLTLKIRAPDFDPPATERRLVLYPERDSEPYSFLLMPKRTGELLINLELSKGEVYLGSGVLRTNGEPVDRGIVPGPPVIVSIPLVVVSYAPTYFVTHTGEISAPVAAVPVTIEGGAEGQVRVEREGQAHQAERVAASAGLSSLAQKILGWGAAWGAGWGISWFVILLVLIVMGGDLTVAQVILTTFGGGVGGGLGGLVAGMITMLVLRRAESHIPWSLIWRAVPGWAIGGPVSMILFGGAGAAVGGVLASGGVTPDCASIAECVGLAIGEGIAQGIALAIFAILGLVVGVGVAGMIGGWRTVMAVRKADPGLQFWQELVVTVGWGIGGVVAFVAALTTAGLLSSLLGL